MKMNENLKKRILFVDDEPMVLKGLQRTLRKMRGAWDMAFASSAQEALAILDNNPMDVIISDMKMPEMSGFELLRSIKKEHPDTGVIIMINYGDTYTVKDALLLGADEYITKPFKSFEVSLIVERAYWRILSESGAPSE